MCMSPWPLTAISNAAVVAKVGQCQKRCYHIFHLDFLTLMATWRAELALSLSVSSWYSYNSTPFLLCFSFMRWASSYFMTHKIKILLCSGCWNYEYFMIMCTRIWLCIEYLTNNFGFSMRLSISILFYYLWTLDIKLRTRHLPSLCIILYRSLST